MYPIPSVPENDRGFENPQVFVEGYEGWGSGYEICYPPQTCTLCGGTRGIRNTEGVLPYWVVSFTDMTCVTDVLSRGGIDPSVAMQPWHTPRRALTKINANTLATSSTV